MTKNKMNYIGILFKGLVHITGETDSGKTLLALTCGADPENIVMMDGDIKGKSTVQDLMSQGYNIDYHDLVKLAEGKREIDFNKACRDIVESYKPGDKDVLVWDVFAPFERTFHALVLKEPNKYREYYSNKGDIKGGEQWQVANALEEQFLSSLLERFSLVFITSHIKADAQIKTRMVSDVRDPVVKKSRMRIWLRANPRGIPQPVGLVLKRLAVPKVTENGIEVINVLPRRIDPCTWGKIREYMANPIGDRPLEPEEKPNEFELSILDGTLTADQKDVLRLSRLQAEKEADLIIEPEYDPEIVAKVVEMKDTPPFAIAKELGVEMSMVLGILSKNGS